MMFADSFSTGSLSQALHDKVRASAKPRRALEESLLNSSAGNFLFVTTALDAVESGQLGFDQIEKLPPGLGSLYQIFFDRLFRDSGMGPLHQVLETLAAAREPLTRTQIAAATGLDAEEELPRSLSRLASFLTVFEGRYTFFHRSLFDWLTGWDADEDRPLAGPYYVSLKKGRARLADRCWTEYERGVPRPHSIVSGIWQAISMRSIVIATHGPCCSILISSRPSWKRPMSTPSSRTTSIYRRIAICALCNRRSDFQRMC